MKHFIFIIISVFTTFPALAQVINYVGKYQGTANWGVQNFEMTIEIQQDGQSLTGIVFIESIKKTKSASYELKGAIMNGTAQLKGTKYIKKKGTWCLPGVALSFETGSTQKLAGKWKSNGGVKGCWVGGVGNINLTRVSGGNTIALQEPALRRQVDIAADDRQGKALSAELEKRNYYALIIAVQDYEDQSIVDLDQPIADARALRDELIAEYTFKPKNITFLQNPDRSTIIETFDELTASVSSTDNLLVFYAGHGIWDEQIEQGYWLPSDAKKGSKAAWLSNGTIRDYIRAIDSKHTLLITDACFGGGILKTREAFTASKAMLEMYKLPSRKAMTSGALKTVPDKSVFIEYLIKGLQANDQPLISADQLFTSFKYNVINNSPIGQVPQYGVISQADDEGGDFIFLKK
jgi:caspase domain-containing protein